MSLKLNFCFSDKTHVKDKADLIRFLEFASHIWSLTSSSGEYRGEIELDISPRNFVTLFKEKYPTVEIHDPSMKNRIRDHFRDLVTNPKKGGHYVVTVTGRCDYIRMFEHLEREVILIEFTAFKSGILSHNDNGKWIVIYGCDILQEGCGDVSSNLMQFVNAEESGYGNNSVFSPQGVIIFFKVAGQATETIFGHPWKILNFEGGEGIEGLAYQPPQQGLANQSQRQLASMGYQEISKMAAMAKEINGI